jgi:hypothetical protein
LRSKSDLFILMNVKYLLSRIDGDAPVRDRVATNDRLKERVGLVVNF